MSPGGFQVTVRVMETGVLEAASDRAPVALRCFAVREKHLIPQPGHCAPQGRHKLQVAPGTSDAQKRSKFSCSTTSLSHFNSSWRAAEPPGNA